MTKRFKPYSLNEPLLLPPDIRKWLPKDHLAHFISDVVDSLDLSPIMGKYKGRGGQPPYHPEMMVKVIFYAYALGKPSSRKIERATYEDVAFRMLAGDQHPDHDTIANFRKIHLEALAGLFMQVLLICKQAGLVKVGHVSLDGTKVKANASKHKSMSYNRMGPTEKRLVQEIEALLAEAEKIDQDEDARYGKGKRGNEIPKELARREQRLKKIREAKTVLEQEAKEKATVKAEIQRAKIEERKRKEEEAGRPLRGRQPNPPKDPEEAVPDPKSQRNFTDPESRIMRDGATKGFVQAYNAQIVVDSEAQVIVAAALTQEGNDKNQLIPMIKAVEENLGCLPEKLSADAGYFSEENITDPSLAEVDLYVAAGRQKHSQEEKFNKESLPENASAAEKMRYKLRTEEGRDVYRMRKAIVEPVFGQIKEARGLRRFSFRGFSAVSLEWKLICLTHNLLKLFRSGFQVHAT